MCAEIIDCPGINDRYRIKVVKNFNIFEMKILINFDESLYFINSCSKLLIFNFSLVIFCLYSYIDLYIFIFFTKYSKCSIFNYTFFMLQLIYRCRICFTCCFHITIINLKIISWLRVIYEYINYYILYMIFVSSIALHGK